MTSLTKGEYEFQVEVEDEAKLTNKSSVKITIMQSELQQPTTILCKAVIVKIRNHQLNYPFDLIRK